MNLIESGVIWTVAPPHVRLRPFGVRETDVDPIVSVRACVVDPRDRIGIELKDRVPDQEPDDPVADEFVVFVVVATPVDRVPRLRVSVTRDNRVTRVAADEGNPHRVARQDFDLGRVLAVRRLVAHGVFDFGLGERIGPVREAGDFEAAGSPHPVIASSDCEVAPLHEAVRRFCHSSTSPSHRG